MTVGLATMFLLVLVFEFPHCWLLWTLMSEFSCLSWFPVAAHSRDSALVCKH